VRSALEPVVPADHEIVGLHDVWIGEPSLVSRVVAADYRIVVRPDAPGAGDETGPEPLPPGSLAAACRRLMAAERLDRRRKKADREVAYDLRPFLLDLEPEGADGEGLLWMRLAADQAAGVGRPDEVVMAVAEAGATRLAMVEGVRERLWLVDELAR
jgi:hypothetical protein